MNCSLYSGYVSTVIPAEFPTNSGPLVAFSVPIFTSAPYQTERPAVPVTLNSPPLITAFALVRLSEAPMINAPLPLLSNVPPEMLAVPPKILKLYDAAAPATAPPPFASYTSCPPYTPPDMFAVPFLTRMPLPCSVEYDPLYIVNVPPATSTAEPPIALCL